MTSRSKPRSFDPTIHQLDPSFDLAPREAVRTIVIAATPRCGSTMLGRLMHATGRMGLPQEYAHPRFRNYLETRFGTAAFEETLAATIRRRTSDNGVFSVKLHAEHLPHIGGFERITALVPAPVFVHLERRDALAQALSFVRAQQTDRWVQEEAGNGRTPSYDFPMIDARLRKIVMDNAEWRYRLSCSGLPVLHLTFEELSADIPAALGRVAALAEIDPASVTIPEQPLTQRQSSDGPDPWRARFVKERQAAKLPALHAPSPAPTLAERVLRRLRGVGEGGRAR